MSPPASVALQYLLPKQALTVPGRAHRVGAQAGALTTAADRAVRPPLRRATWPRRPTPTRQALPDASTSSSRAPSSPACGRWPQPTSLCPVDGSDQPVRRRSTAGAAAAGQGPHLQRGPRCSAAMPRWRRPTRAAASPRMYLSPEATTTASTCPCQGRLVLMRHVPGDAVQRSTPTTARGVPGLFARNERVVCHFENDRTDPFVMVLVGATIVGSMATAWHGVVNPPRTGAIREWDYATSRSCCSRARRWGASCSAPPS